ncbi:MAG: P1 family peptidase [Bacillota bacterium]
MEKIKINEIENIEIGHAQNKKALTGCSVALFKKGAVAGVDIRGGAPGSRETALLRSDKLVEKIHAIVLAGGSAYGLDAASGVMKYLEENNIGFDTGAAKVPIVSSAILYDLDIGDPKIRPDQKMGYDASLNASNEEFKSGNIGVGLGATVGKIAGKEKMMKGGLGSVAYKIGNLKVAAIVAVNSLGDIINPKNGEILAGALNKDDKSFLGTEKFLYENYDKNHDFFKGNTSLGIVFTNAKLNKVEANKLAVKAHNGYAKTMSPAHTDFDGDSIFAVSSANVKADFNVIAMLAIKAIKNAVIDAIKSAESLKGIKAYRDLKK